jgi:hypothetical protein
MLKVMAYINRAARDCGVMGMLAVLGAGLVVAPAPAAARAGVGALIVHADDAQTGASIADALVYLYDGNGFVVDKSMTDRNGVTVFDAAEGAYKLVTFADGYDTMHTGAIVFAGRKSVARVRLEGR